MAQYNHESAATSTSDLQTELYEKQPNKLVEVPSRVAEPTEDVEKAYDKASIASRDANGMSNDKSMLSRVVSSVSRASEHLDPGPPPDGGLHAWTQVFLAHLAMMTTWGYINSFGLFQTYYESTLNVSPSSISWVGTMQVFILFLFSTFSGRALDAGYFKIVFIVGTFFQLVGVFMLSLCTQYWQIFLAQGVCTGLGNSLMFTPIVGLVSTYFSRKKALAIALVASGTATGGMLFPGIVSVALPSIGFPWTVRILGFIMLVFGVLAAIGMEPRLPPRKGNAFVEWGAFKEPTYIIFCLGMFLNFWALYFAFYYIGTYAQDKIGFSYDGSIYLLIVLNGVGAIGRLVPAYIADNYCGPLNTVIPCAFICSILLYCWAAVDSKVGIWVFAAIYGMPGAALQGLWPATLTSLTTDLQKTGTRIGMGFTIVSVAFLTGSPLGGAIVSSMGGDYLGAQMWAGSTLLAGTALLVVARVAKTGWVFRARV